MDTYGLTVMLTKRVRDLAADGAFTDHARQCRVIVAAKSRAAALRAFQMAGFRVTAHDVANYGGVTGNPAELAMTSGRPGVVFAAPALNRREDAYVEVPPSPEMLPDPTRREALDRIAEGGVADSGRYQPRADALDAEAIAHLHNHGLITSTKGLFKVTPLGKYAMQLHDEQNAK